MTGKIVFVIGVSGCGKSTVAQSLAKTSGGVFLEGDEYHPPENIAAMSAGKPLTDDMRWGWLQDLGQAAADNAKAHDYVFVACSGLKRAYRDTLRKHAGPCRMIFLRGAKSLILARMALRKDHYMPTALLDSQFDALEEPTPEETDVFAVDIDANPDAVISKAELFAFSGD